MNNNHSVTTRQEVEERLLEKNIQLP